MQSGWNPPLFLIIALALCPLAIPLLLFIAGMRGRRVGDHPVCRKCGFDLRGRATSSTNCPECGADITAAGAIAIGDRRRIKPLLWLAAIVLLLWLAGAGLGGWRIGRQIDWIRYEPAAWVIRDAASATGAAKNAAQTELARRMAEGDLSSSQSNQVIELALADQAKGSWSGWWSFIEQAGRHGMLSEAQEKRLLENALSTAVRGRPIVRREHYQYIDHQMNWNLGSGSELNITYSSSLNYGGLLIDSAFIRQRDVQRIGGNWSAAYGGRAAFTRRNGIDRLPDGEHDLTAHTQVQVELLAPWKSRKTYTIHKDATQRVKLVAKDAIVDEFVKADPELKKGVEAAVKEVVLDCAEDGKAITMIRTDRLPVALAMEVLLQRPASASATALSNPIRIGEFRRGAGMMDYWNSASWGRRMPFTDGVADVILRPSQDAAESNERIDRYWGEQILIPNVPVKSAKPHFNNDPSLRAAVESGIWIELQAPQDNGALSVIVHAGNVPTLLSYTLLLRGGGNEVKVGTVRLPPQNTNYSSWENGHLPAKGLKQVDVILRPRIDSFSHPAKEGLPWAGEIIYTGVPVPGSTRSLK
jgi:hypothetical protein